MKKITEKEIFDALKEGQMINDASAEADKLDKIVKENPALQYTIDQAAKFSWLKIHLQKGFHDGVTEFRIVMHTKKKGIIHPLGKDGTTIDFTL